MSLQSIKAGIYLPEIPNVTALAGMFAGLVIDAAAEKVAFIFQIPKTGTITTLGFLTGVVTTADTLKVGLYTVDPATGVPTATAYGGMVAGTQAAPASNTFYEVALGTNASATVDDVVAMVIEFNSFVAGNLKIAMMDATVARGFPYVAHYAPAAWAKYGYTPDCVVKYNDGTYGPEGCLPIITSAATSFTTTSTPDEVALRVSVPFVSRAWGCWILVDADADCEVILYEGTTVRATATIDKDVRGATVGRIFQLKFPTAYALAANTEYFLALKPSGTVSYYDFSINAAGIMDCFSGGQNIYFASRTDAGAWSLNTSRRLWAGLILDQFDDGAGGGGGINSSWGSIR